MEDLTNNWSELSLSNWEHTGFVLPKIHKSGEYIIVAKFLTLRYLVMEAVVHTFQQQWRSVNGYKIWNLGDHMVLFVFDNILDVERIIENQPWSFDKHLVVLQTFEEFSKLKDLVFDKALFWVQVHAIPIHFISKKVVESIRETIWEVRRSLESTDDNGGNFIQYERCGHLKHDDKQCELWIRSKSFLTIDKQQFGSYLKVAPYQTSGRRVIENDVLSTLAEIDDDINFGFIPRHPTTADLKKVAESKRLAETARLLEMKTLYYHKSSILDSTLPKILGLSFKDNKSPSKPVGSVMCLQGDNKGRSYRSDNNYPTYSDHVQGAKGFKGDQV